MTKKLRFQAIRARQSDKHEVLSFAASARDIGDLATIERIRRDEGGHLRGFQRPQISSHIHEIRDYLAREDAVLPNPIVIAFIDRVRTIDLGDNRVILEVDVSDGAPGLVVDGQQRLTALTGLTKKKFQVFVSALLCRDEEELRRQFILINNTRPLPKSLIYELLPSVDDLPDRMSSRSRAARLTEVLNYDEESSLHGQIKQHTNPYGVITDTAVQKLIMNSLADGACRYLISQEDGDGKCRSLVSEFFFAVQQVFSDSWENHTPKTSRLVHGAGIVALGYVMEFLHARDNAKLASEFAAGLTALQGHTAWTVHEGSWQFGAEVRPWNGIQNLHRDIQLLAAHLVRVLKHAPRRESKEAVVEHKMAEGNSK